MKVTKIKASVGKSIKKTMNFNSKGNWVSYEASADLTEQESQNWQHCLNALDIQLKEFTTQSLPDTDQKDGVIRKFVRLWLPDPKQLKDPGPWGE